VLRMAVWEWAIVFMICAPAEMDGFEKA
jgi:hypothetical protein